MAQAHDNALPKPQVLMCLLIGVLPTADRNPGKQIKQRLQKNFNGPKTVFSLPNTAPGSYNVHALADTHPVPPAVTNEAPPLIAHWRFCAVPQPNKIGASELHDFYGLSLTVYGGILPVVRMLEKPSPLSLTGFPMRAPSLYP